MPHAKSHWQGQSCALFNMLFPCPITDTTSGFVPGLDGGKKISPKEDCLVYNQTNGLCSCCKDHFLSPSLSPCCSSLWSLYWLPFSMASNISCLSSPSRPLTIKPNPTYHLAFTIELPMLPSNRPMILASTAPLLNFQTSSFRLSPMAPHRLRRSFPSPSAKLPHYPPENSSSKLSFPVRPTKNLTS